jgi:hypothetical protein
VGEKIKFGWAAVIQPRNQRTVANGVTLKVLGVCFVAELRTLSLAILEQITTSVVK